MKILCIEFYFKQKAPENNRGTIFRLFGLFAETRASVFLINKLCELPSRNF